MTGLGEVRIESVVTDVRIFGATEMTIEYLDYTPNASPLSAHEDAALRSPK